MFPAGSRSRPRRTRRRICPRHRPLTRPTSHRRPHAPISSLPEGPPVGSASPHTGLTGPSSNNAQLHTFGGNAYGVDKPNLGLRHFFASAWRVRVSGGPCLTSCGRCGELLPPGRPPGGHRIYPARTVTLLRMVKIHTTSARPHSTSPACCVVHRTSPGQNVRRRVRRPSPCTGSPTPSAACRPDWTNVSAATACQRCEAHSRDGCCCCLACSTTAMAALTAVPGGAERLAAMPAVAYPCAKAGGVDSLRLVCAY